MVEDSDDDAELLLIYLRRNGYEIQFDRVHTASEMRQMLASNEYDVIISDFSLPGFNGMEAFRIVKENDLDVPFIITSGTIGEDLAVESMVAGVNDYLMKDNLTRLVPAIEREIKEAKNRHARREAELALKKSEEQYRELFENANDIIFTIDLDGNFTSINKKGKKIFPLQIVENPNSNFAELITETEFQKFSEMLEQKLSGKTDKTQLEFEIVTQQKQVKSLEISSRLIYSDGKPSGVQCIARDITERKTAEKVLRESEAKFRALVQATSLIVWTINPDGTSENLPQWWTNLTGQSLAESKKFGWLDFVHPDDREETRLICGQAFAEYKVFSLVFRVLTLENKYCYLAVRGVPILDEKGVLHYWIGTINDITERKVAEIELNESKEKLLQAQKLESIGRLTGGIAHDFNNMLTVINGYSEMTLRRLPFDDSARGYVEQIKQAAERSTALTNQLLAFSRRQVLNVEIVDINKVISDMNLLIERLIGEDIDLISNLSSDPGRIKADPNQISQVILNLVINSRDAMPEGGTITIETTKVKSDEIKQKLSDETLTKDYVKLVVKDTGIGIDEENRERIFEPFFTTKEIGKGTGLGLAMVYGTIKQSNGHIWVESELGKGTGIEIYLPVFNEEHRISEKKKFDKNLLHGTETILIVEDQHLVRELSQNILESYGYTVFQATDGEDALEKFNNYPKKIDLLLTDVVMPKMGGYELAKVLSQIYPRLKILFMSGYTEDSRIKDNLFDSSDNFIKKPFEPEILAVKVREVLEKELKT